MGLHAPVKKLFILKRGPDSVHDMQSRIEYCLVQFDYKSLHWTQESHHWTAQMGRDHVTPPGLSHAPPNAHHYAVIDI